MNNRDTLEKIFQNIQIVPHSHVLDVGCGNAGALCFLKEKYHLTGNLIGIDKRANNFESSDQQKKLGVTLTEWNASASLPFPDGSFDLIFHKDTMECILDPDHHIRELHRVLKQGGSVICAHRDWETIALNGLNKPLINKAVYGYANYLQSGWMDSCDGWIGRRVYGYFHKTGLFESSVFCINEIETEYHPGTKGYRYVQDIGESIKPDGFLTKQESKNFLADIQKTYERKEYLFSYPLYVYRGIKR